MMMEGRQDDGGMIEERQDDGGMIESQNDGGMTVNVLTYFAIFCLEIIYKHVKMSTAWMLCNHSDKEACGF